MGTDRWGVTMVRSALIVLLSIVLAGATRPVAAQDRRAWTTAHGIEAALKREFPNSNVDDFACGETETGVICRNLVSHPKPDANSTHGVNFMLEIANDGGLVSMVALTASPTMATGREAEYFATIFYASAISVLTVAVPEIKSGDRLNFVNRVLKSGDKGVAKGAWQFTGGGGLFATFSVKRR